MSYFRILSLDGGGIRGAFTAGFLAEIERQTGQRVADYFDLLAGTSTGGIIAAAFALGEPAEKVEMMYRTRRHTIFTRRQPVDIPWLRRLGLWAARCKFPDLDADNLFQPKYNTESLLEALLEVFGHRTLEQMRHRLVLPSVNLTKGQTVVFKTPHFPGLFRDRDVRTVDAVLATTAAPTYFPCIQIAPGTAYVDGGLWANNPAMVAIAEAMKIQQECGTLNGEGWGGLSNIHMLSVGTGHQPYFLAPPKGQDGLFFWGTKIIDTMGSTQSQGTDFQAAYLLEERLIRVNFTIPDKGWKLDCVELVDQLIHMGKEMASSHLSRIQSRFLYKKASRYVPYPKNTPIVNEMVASAAI